MPTLLKYENLVCLLYVFPAIFLTCEQLHKLLRFCLFAHNFEGIFQLETGFNASSVDSLQEMKGG